MNRLSVGIICLWGLAVLGMPAIALAAAVPQPARAAQEKPQKEDAFDKAGKATEGALKKAGRATEKGLEAAGKGTGAAVEHTGRGATTAAKATAGALASTGHAIADFFDGNPGDQDRVREVQRVLHEKGYSEGPIDGIAGPKTRSGVREFQQDEELAVTGKVDEKTPSIWAWTSSSGRTVQDPTRRGLVVSGGEYRVSGWPRPVTSGESWRDSRWRKKASSLRSR